MQSGAVGAVQDGRNDWRQRRGHQGDRNIVPEGLVSSDEDFGFDVLGRKVGCCCTGRALC